MQKWEYLVANVHDHEVFKIYDKWINPKPQLASWLEKAGNDGWELIAATGDAISYCMFFKRPKPDPTQQTRQ